ncbi:MAG TPA: S41 family peptidase [Chloroflexota bacterium]|nr:S41 family peptidase [Chloroflexota bacterium]
MRRVTTAVFVLFVLAFVLGTGYTLGLAAGRGEGANGATVGLASLLQRVAPPVAAATGTRSGAPSSVSPEFQEQFQTFWETWSLVDREYYDRGALDSKKLTRGAIKGMLEAIGDPHTVYLDPDMSEVSDAELRGGFEGIGVHVDLVDGKLRVVAPIEGSPSEKAGLRAGDYIVQADGKDLAGLTLLQAVNLIRGPRGTAVRLMVQRDGWPEPRPFDVTRSDIKLESVRTRLLDGNVGYVRITTFANTTARDLRGPLDRLLEARPRGLVLDLRSNPGGYLQAALDVASEFVPEGVLLTEEYADGRREVFRAKPGGHATQVPLVVLVDHGSASAAEIVAGAIRDHGRGILVGEQTFGKGTVQHVHALADHSTVRITIARWLTPNEQPLNGVGLAPDIAVAAGSGTADPVLDRALQYLRDQR